MALLQNLGPYAAAFHGPQTAFPYYNSNDVAGSDGAANNQQKIDPFLNLVASNHNAFVVPNEDPSVTVLEIRSNELQEQDSAHDRMDDLPSNPNRQLNVVDSTTTMGAVTFMAFLNLLGYIQSVLGSTGRRKKRSISHNPSDQLVETSAVSPRGSIPVAPVPSFFEEIMRGLGYWAQREEEQHARDEVHAIESRMDDTPIRRSKKGSWRSFFSYLGQRVKLASNVMNFLNNPNPARIRRSLDAPVPLPRSKRFTSTMNAWYDQLAGMNYDGKDHAQPKAGSDMLSSLMLGLGRQILGR